MTFDVDVKTREMGEDERLYEYVISKTAKLEKFLNGINNAKVELVYDKNAKQVTDRYVVQITIRGKGFMLRAEERTDDIFVSFDSALEKLQRRIEKYKGKRFRGRGDGKSLAKDAMEALEMDEREEAEGEELVIARRKKFTLIPMDEQEALLQSNLLGHEDFFVFYNMDSASVCVLYKRRNGSYGLIETEIG